MRTFFIIISEVKITSAEHLTALSFYNTNTLIFRELRKSVSCGLNSSLQYLREFSCTFSNQFTNLLGAVFFRVQVVLGVENF
jgi:hypothetical protein